MKEYLTADEKNLVRRLLDRNTENNHFRIIIATGVITTLIIIVVLVMKWMGITTPAINYPTLFKAFVISAVILTILTLLMKHYGANEWSKWAMLTGVFLIFVILRSCSNDAPETHALSYLPIVMGLFYFDAPLIVFITVLSIAGDILLLHIYPGLRPTGGINAPVTRYFCYCWAGIAAVIGSQATRQLLQLGITLKTTNETLQEDIRQKIKLDKEKKEFIAAVSHDLQTPVSLIKGYAEGLKDGIVQGQEREEFVEIIIDEARKMGLLVSNMLDYSQLDSGYLQLQQEDFCIDELLRHNLRQFSNPLKEKSIKAGLNFSNPGILVFADPYRIDLVISNFLNNAIRHTPHQGQININLIPQAGHVLIEIENEGEYIPEESLSRIWDPFYRVEQSRSSKYGGTGLGLSIAGTILQLHQSAFGAINIPSGVKFYFTLPIAVE